MFKKLKFLINFKNAEHEYKTMPFMALHMVGLADWLESYQGNTSRLQWLSREIWQRAGENEMLKRHIYMMCDKSGRTFLALDEIGVFLCNDILIGFFGTEECHEMYRALEQANRIPRFYQKFQLSLQEKGLTELKETEKIWQGDNICSETFPEEARQNMLLIIRNELKSRK